MFNKNLKYTSCIEPMLPVDWSSARFIRPTFLELQYLNDDRMQDAFSPMQI